MEFAEWILCKIGAIEALRALVPVTSKRSIRLLSFKADSYATSTIQKPTEMKSS